MALSYLSVDRDQPFLLPPDVREWLPVGHLAWFVIDVVAEMDTGALHDRHPNDGVGRRAYNPEMLLALLMYAYCTKVRSSRQIERLCEVDVAYRVVAANRVPDHTTIARFRQDYQDLVVEMFTDVLMLCARAGLAKVGVVAVDGSKVGTDAALAANRTREQIEVEVRKMLDEAAAADAAEDGLFGDDRGDELPPELRDPRTRRARLGAALAELEAERAAPAAEREAALAAHEARKAKAASEGRRVYGRVPPEVDVVEAEAAIAAEEAKMAAWAQVRAEREAAAAAAGRKLRGPAPQGKPSRGLRWAHQRLARAQAREAKRQAAARGSKVNITDPESRTMCGIHGWVQGYNAQAAVNATGITLAAEVTQDENDFGQCVPMMEAVQANLVAAGVTDQVGLMLFDAGYCSEANLTAPGPDRLIATEKAWRLHRAEPTEGDPPEGATPEEVMDHRLRTSEGKALYAKRGQTIEPLFGNVKDARGFQRFTRRGLAAATAEWRFILATNNILKLHRHSHGIAEAAT